MELLVVACLAFGVALAASWAGAAVALAPLRKAKPTHWVERARLGFPARAVSRFALLLLPIAFGVFASLGSTYPSAPAGLVILCAALPAFGAAFLVRLHVERVLRQRRVGVGEVLRGWLGLWTVMYPHVAIALAGAWLADDTLDARSWAVLAVTALAVVVAMAGGGAALARLLRLARPASERLRRAVDAATAATGVKARWVLEVDIRMANAFALPAARLLLFTPLAVDALDDAQITAVARHELGHVSEPMGVVALRVVNAMVVILAIVAARPVSGALSPDPGLTRLAFAVVLLAAAVVFARLVFRPLSRRMEERADRIAHGAGAHGHDGEGAVYASALEAIYAANLVPAVMSVRGAHPHLYDRMVAAGVTPAWPRPAPPSRSRLRASMAVCLAVTAVALTVAIEVLGIALAF
jgi:Zn-dependent protease with chaperone function